MRHGKGCYWQLLVVVMTFPFVSAAAQVTTGIPPFQSFGGGPDVINLGNLNVHYSIPVFSRAGRGIPFSYALAYDSSVWRNAGSTWFPDSNWGFGKDIGALVGTVSVSVLQHRCIDHDTGQTIYWNSYTFGNYRDAQGTLHPFVPLLQVHDEEADGICTNPLPTASGVSTDGSGITMSVSYSPSASVKLPSGETIIPVLLGGGSSNGTQTDNNGNQITSSTVSGTTTFTDTLGTTALTITGTAPSPVNYKYTAPSGALAQVQVTYVAKTVQTNFGCSGISEYGPLSNSLVDKITLPDGSYYQFTYEATPGFTTNVTGRIASVRLPTGGTISYAYTGGDTGKGIMCIDGSTAGFDRTTPDSSTPWHYLRTGTSPAYTTTITDPQGNQTVISFQGNFETEREVYQGAATGTPLSDVITCYNGNITNCPTTAITTPFTQITKFTSLNGGSQAHTDTFLNGYGLPTEVDQYDFGATTPTRKTITTYAALGNGIVDHPASVVVKDGADNLKRQTTYGYDQTTPTATTGVPNHVSVTGARGNLTTITTYSTSTASLSRTFTYYDTGTVKTATDVNNAVTTYSYAGTSCGSSFPTSVTLPLSLTRSMTWNCTGGVMTSSTDENGKTTYTNYTTDQYFWRPESTKDALLNVTNLSYPSLTQSESYLNFNGTVSTVDVVTTLDSLGRVKISQRKQGQGSTTYDSVQQTYDALGRPYQVSMPYAGAKGAGTSGGPVTTTYYDALGRPTQVVDGGGGITNLTYTKNDVYSEAAPAPTVPPAPATENTKRKQLQYDALGRLRSVCEVTSGANSGACGQTVAKTGYLTTYTYDTSPNFNSLSVTQNGQPGGGTSQTRTYIYDMLGRLTSETNPETSNLAYTYVYDSDATCGTSGGDLVKRTDAKGNVTCYAYDLLHRVLSLTYPSGPNAPSTAKKYFTYDNATVNSIAMVNAKGRLAEAFTCTTCPGTKITDLGFSYSARGEVTDVYESTPHSGGYYHVTASYWAHGALNALNGLPGLPTIYYGASDGSGLDGEGRITKVTASSGQNPATGVTYTTSGTTQPIGSLTQVTLGSGDNDAFSYDINTGRLNQYKFNIGATPQTVQGDLTWNANGTLAKLVIADPFNTVNNQTCTFGYDDLARIKSANCGSAWNQTFTPDPFGNVTKTGTISFQPGYNQTKNWFLSLPGLSYDNNGNLQNDSFHTYSWDAENKLLTVDTVGLTFDALGRMVEQARGASYTEIVYSPTGGKLALMNGLTTPVKTFVPLPGGATAVYTSSGLAYYRHSDWLGSSRFASTPSRTKYFDVAYAPYGENYADSGAVDLNFTGQNQDTVSGLYDFMYREYHPVAGRWIQPDPAGIGASDPTNPQTWNRYAYVGNMPTVAVDPLGLWRSDAFGFDNSCSINGFVSNCAVVNSFASTGGGGQFGFLCYGNCDAFNSGAIRIGPDNRPYTPANGFSDPIEPDSLNELAFLPTGGFSLVTAIGGGSSAANNGFTLGVRAPGQTWTQCMSSTSGAYSINGVLPTSWQNGATSVLAGNDVSQILFGDSSEGSAGLLVWEGGSNSVEAGVGSVMTAGRRTASIMDLNLAGKTGPAARILGKTGAEKLAGFLTGVAEIKMAIDVGLTGAQAIGCAIHR